MNSLLNGGLWVFVVVTVCEYGREVDGCTRTPVTTTTSSSTTSTTTTTTTTTTSSASCMFYSMMDNVAAFGSGTNNPCTTTDCTTTQCLCTMAHGTNLTISPNQCVDNANFCITTNGITILLTAPIVGSIITCSDGVETITDINGVDNTAPIEKIACTTIVGGTPPPTCS